MEAQSFLEGHGQLEVPWPCSRSGPGPGPGHGNQLSVPHSGEGGLVGGTGRFLVLPNGCRKGPLGHNGKDLFPLITLWGQEMYQFTSKSVGRGGSKCVKILPWPLIHHVNVET